MKLFLTRTNKTPTSTLGELHINNEHFCFTLERPLSSLITNGPFCIPEGTYNFTIEWMGDMRIHAPLLQNVPGRDGIFIHPGNFPRDTKGCILVGTTQAVDYIGNSRIAFAQLLAELGSDNENTITIS
jgi:hypothetical protein